MKSHSFDPLSFVFGVILLLIAGAGAWNQSFRWDIGAWVLPAAVLFVGLALLVSTLRSSSKRSDIETAEMPSEAPTES